jgi:hypothetical protein
MSCIWNTCRRAGVLVHNAVLSIQGWPTTRHGIPPPLKPPPPPPPPPPPITPPPPPPHLLYYNRAGTPSRRRLGVDFLSTAGLSREKVAANSTTVVPRDAVERSYGLSVYDVADDRSARAVPWPKGALLQRCSTGNEAIGMGMYAAGWILLRYPMTPSSSFSFPCCQCGGVRIAWFTRRMRSPWSNLAIGAGVSWAGSRWEQRGGLALMEEGSRWQVCRKAFVCVLFRGGPSTGVPTYTAKATLPSRVGRDTESTHELWLSRHCKRGI